MVENKARTQVSGSGSYSLEAYPEKDPCSYTVTQADRQKLWANIIAVFGEQGLPSCGLTDARVLGSRDEDEPQSAGNTIYLK